MTSTTNIYYAILIAVGIGATIFMVIVTLTHEDIFGQTVKVGMLKDVIEQAGITEEDFITHL
jgi:hypothetical protein